jgi:peptidoglycan/xylan/chitin deacetylase (PgdA/CDA1 family)
MIRPAVLCYHRVGGPLELGITRVSRSVFARQMTALAKAGWRTLTLDEFARTASPYLFPVARLSSAGGGTFLLTFDDGYASLAEQAYPVLADLGFTATTFLITDYIGRDNLWDVRYTRHRMPHLDWATIEKWQARGFDFGSHSASHRRLTWMRKPALAEDLARSRETLISRLGAQAGRAIAYPFGATNLLTVELARVTGFELGFAGVWQNYSDPLCLPRIPAYLWDVGRFPLGLRAGPIGTVGRFVAHVANRCAVGTSIMLALAGLFRRGRGVEPAPERDARQDSPH